MSNVEGAEVPRFRIAICTELGPRPAFVAAAGKGSRRPERIDKLSLAPLFASIAPSLSIEVPDPFVAGMVRVEVTFREAKGLKPDWLGEQQPDLRALVEAHRVLRDGTSSAAQLTERLPRILTRPTWSSAVLAALNGEKPAPVAKAPAAPPAAAPPSTEGLLSRLLDQVDVAPSASADDPDAPPPVNPGTSRVSSLIASVARGSSAPRTGTNAKKALELIERAYRSLLTSILEQSEMRRLASAWLGLRWFVDRCDFRAGVELEVAAVPVGEVLRTLTAWTERDDDSEERPIDLFIVDQALTADDVPLLASWAAVTANARTPLVVSVAATVLGVGHLSELDDAVRKSDDPASLVDARLQAFARTDDARWVVAAANGAIARAAHVTARGSEITFEETEQAAAADQVAPSLLVGVLCATSHERSGWATDLQGNPGGVIDDLPLGFTVDDGENLQIPLHALVRETAARALGREGIAIASCVAHRDQALFFRVPTLFRERTGEPTSPERATTTLGDQLFTRRLASALDLVADAVPATADVRAIEETVTIVLSDLFDGQREKPELRIGVEGDAKPGARILRLACLPHGFRGVSLDRIDLAARLGS